MPTGVNNVFIRLNEFDTGSVIAYGLQSNIYYEALIRTGYMGLNSNQIVNESVSTRKIRYKLTEKTNVFEGAYTQK